MLLCKTHSKKDDEEEPFIEKHGNQEDEAPSIASLRERLFGSKNNLPRQKGGGIEGENNVHNYTVDLEILVFALTSAPFEISNSAIPA